MTKLSHTATPESPLFLALARTKKKPSRREWSERDNVTRARRLERRAAENREHIAKMRSRQADEAARKLPELYAYVRSSAFLAWYQSRTGHPWDTAMETDPYLVVSEIRLFRDGQMPLPEARELTMLLADTEK